MLEIFLLITPFCSIPQAPPAAIEQTRIQSIALYYSPRCPHSQKVLSYLNTTDLSIPLKDVTKSSVAKEELRETGGHLIVPCLIVNGSPIYNDHAIIEWMSDHHDQLPKRAP